MKALTSPESPGHKARRKVSKPMMEKRRRERINSSLETLRLLMLENTQNEKLKNPKVEKAEILESVVEFLKKEKKDTEEDHQAARKTFPEEQRPTFSTHHSYQDGMRSCLLRVSQFIASKNRELEGSHALRASLELSECETVVSSAVPLHVSPLVVPANVPAVLSPQHLLFQQSETRQMLSSSSSSTVPAHFTDPVWRPWPK